jgi:hypothetical protein
MDSTLTDIDKAVLRLARYELQYQRLLNATLKVLVTRRPLSTAQEAVLTSALEDLKNISYEKTPGIDYRT